MVRGLNLSELQNMLGHKAIEMERVDTYMVDFGNDVLDMLKQVHKYVKVVSRG